MKKILIVSLLAVFAPGCFYGGGDKAMVSATRNQLKRAHEKLATGDIEGAAKHVSVADESMAAVEERHGRSRKEWPDDDTLAAKEVQRSIGAYKSNTKFMMRIVGLATGFFGVLGRNPFTSLLVGLGTPFSIFLIALIKRQTTRMNEERKKKEAAEVAQMEFGDRVLERARKGDSFVDDRGEATEAFRDASLPVKGTFSKLRRSGGD